MEEHPLKVNEEAIPCIQKDEKENRFKLKSPNRRRQLTTF